MSNPLPLSNHPNFKSEQTTEGMTPLYGSPVANSQRGPSITHFTEDECSSAALPPTTSDQPAVEQFATGAKRGTDHSDCYLHLIPPEALYEYGRAFAEGAKKYGLHNWLKGFPFSGLMNHALHHLYAYISGDRSEPHLGHALWNVGSMIHFAKTRPELNDLPPYREYSHPEIIGPDLSDIDPNAPRDEYTDSSGTAYSSDPRIHFTNRESSLAMMTELPLMDSNLPPSGPHWEVKDDDDNVMSRVRWSEPNDKGEYLWTAHYPFELRHLAESTARNWNKLKRHPSEWDHYVGSSQNARVAAEPKLSDIF
jgi:hypothetical protein